MAGKKKPPEATISKTVILESVKGGWVAKAEAERPGNAAPQPRVTKGPRLSVVDKEEAEALSMWPIFKDIIEKRFGSLTTFAREAGIPKDRIMKVLTRAYGPVLDAKYRWLMRQAFLRLGVPNERLENLWAIFLEDGPTQFVTGQGRHLMVSTDIVVEDLGPAYKTKRRGREEFYGDYDLCTDLKKNRNVESTARPRRSEK